MATVATIEYDARCDGIFPLITNDRDLSLVEILTAYQYQPRPRAARERGPHRGLLFLYFVVLLVQALLEREVRRAMSARGLTSLPLYPEDRDCPAPSANGIFQVFAGPQHHRLRRQDTLVQTFSPELIPLQRQILDLLGISPQVFTGAVRS